MCKKNILVTGGAGYIGSHCVLQLIEAGYSVIVVDNLSTGYRELVHPKAIFFEGDISDEPFILKILDEYTVDAVLHFAASIVVSDSVAYPLKYYTNNTAKTLTFIQALQKRNVNAFIFSSTAAVYGQPEGGMPVSEDVPLCPINPYGSSKLFSENIIRDLAKSNPVFKYGILRYFNVAGAAPQLISGQISRESTHLIKVLAEAAHNKRNGICVFGTDYNTEDGTCVRDYIHVVDLVNAHIILLEYLLNGGTSETFNVGYGKGYSVKDVINAMQEVSGADFNIKYTERRLGDPAILVSDSSKIKKILNWKPRFEAIETICRHAYMWEGHIEHFFNAFNNK